MTRSRLFRRLFPVLLLAPGSGCATVLYAAAAHSDGDFPLRQAGAYALVSSEISRREWDQVPDGERYAYRGGSASSVVLTRYLRGVPSPDMIQRPVDRSRVVWPPSMRPLRPEGPRRFPEGSECQWLGETGVVDVNVRSPGRAEAGRAGAWYTRCGAVTTATFEVVAPNAWYTLVMQSEHAAPNLTEFVALANRLLEPVCTGCRFDTP